MNADNPRRLLAADEGLRAHIPRAKANFDRYALWVACECGWNENRDSDLTWTEHLAATGSIDREKSADERLRALLEWAEEREQDVRAEHDWPFSGAYANAFRDEFIPRLRAALAATEDKP